MWQGRDGSAEAGKEPESRMLLILPLLLPWDKGNVHLVAMVKSNSMSRK